MQSRVDIDALLQQVSARLDPDNIMVDGRDICDRLAFIASLAELIVYYDENNQPAGNWRALMLKDPVILLAVISKTPYQHVYERFSQIQPFYQQAKQRLSLSPATPLDPFSNPDPLLESSSTVSGWTVAQKTAVHQLFLLLDTLFESLNGWMSNMEQGQTQYHLRQFMTQHIDQTFSLCLQQRVAIQMYLAREAGDHVSPVSSQAFSDFLPQWHYSFNPSDPFNQTTNDQTTMNRPPTSVTEALDLLEQIYHQVFSFYVQVTTSAREAFDQLRDQPCDFPDTALLIAFHHLLTFSQQGLNRYSQQHLQFYYQDILHQQMQAATPDRTYLCLTLAQGHLSIDLPVGVTFVGGHYTDKTPILFATTRTSEINQAQLGQLVSSSYGPDPTTDAGDGDPAVVRRQQRIAMLPDSRQIRRNASHQMLASDWFSGRQRFGGQQTQVVQQGFVLASQMLALRSGTRTVTITLSLDQAVDVTAWQTAGCWLSSAKAWVEVTNRQWAQGETPHQLCLTLTLAPTFPAVTPFAKPPAGYEMALPGCRIMLPDTLDLQQIPRLLNLEIQVTVEQSLSFVLSNNHGVLVPGKPMPILGVRPDVGSHCYLSDPEAFGKPLTQLSLSLLWEPLAADFSQYYAGYNTSIHQQGGPEHTFENSAFQVAWQVGTTAGWETVAAQISPYSDENPAPDMAPTLKPRWYVRGWRALWHKKTPESEPVTQPVNGLFAQKRVIQKRKAHLENAAGTQYQLTFSESLTFRDAMIAGQPQLRMTLISPAAGFGASMYPRLVSEVSLSNAKILMNGAGLLGPVVKLARGLGHLVGMKSLGVVQPLPELPWVVKAKQACTGYQASQRLDFQAQVPQAPVLQHIDSQTQETQASQTQGATDAPVETSGRGPDFALLHIGVFATYPYFYQQAGQHQPDIDARTMQFQPVMDAENVEGSGAAPSADNGPQGLALYPGVSRPANGLYLQLTHVTPPCRVNVLIELAPDISGDSQPNTVELFYWGIHGWQALSILQDQTCALTRSGILQIDLPQDVVLNPPQFPAKVSTTVRATKTTGSVWLLMTQASTHQVSCVYCNTQGIEVVRQTPIPLPVGECPVLAAGAIRAPAVNHPAIASLVQPLASVGGRAQESAAVFRSRVSQRLKTKDRASSLWDYTLLARQACPDLFYVRRLPSDIAGMIQLGVVQSCASAQVATAFRPVVARGDLQQIEAVLSARMSAMAQIRVRNLSYEPVTVIATLVIQETTNASELLQALNTGINLYLSPWIQTTQAQYRISDGLSLAALTCFLAEFAGVVAVPSLQLSMGETGSDSSSDRMILPHPDRIFVSSLAHRFQLTRVGTAGMTATNPHYTGVPQNQLTEAY